MNSRYVTSFHIFKAFILTFSLPKPILWSAKIMVRVIGQKILGVQDLQTLQTSYSPHGIDLEKSKSAVKFSNAFNLDLRMLKKKCYILLLLQKIQRLRVVNIYLFNPGYASGEIQGSQQIPSIKRELQGKDYRCMSSSMTLNLSSIARIRFENIWIQVSSLFSYSRS